MDLQDPVGLHVLETLELHQPSLLNDIAARLHASIRQHTSAYVSIRQHTSAYVLRQHTSAYVSIRQHTSAYVSIRQHTHKPPLFNGIAARLQHAPAC
jgi:hypothetical protein